MIAFDVVVLIDYMFSRPESLGQLLILDAFSFGCLDMINSTFLKMPTRIRCVQVSFGWFPQHTLARNSIRDCPFMVLVQRVCKRNTKKRGKGNQWHEKLFTLIRDSSWRGLDTIHTTGSFGWAIVIFICIKMSIAGVVWNVEYKEWLSLFLVSICLFGFADLFLHAIHEGLVFYRMLNRPILSNLFGS